MALQAIAGLAGLGVNIFGQMEANRRRKRLQAQGLGILDRQLAEESQFAAGQQQQLTQGIQDINTGFDNAQIAAANQGRSARRSALDRSASLQSRASSQLAGSGLLNSSVQLNIDQGIGAQTDRRLAEIDQGLSGLFSNLATQRAGALSQGRQGLANFFGQRQARRAQLNDTRFDLLNTQSNFQPVDIGGLVSAFGGG